MGFDGVEGGERKGGKGMGGSGGRGWGDGISFYDLGAGSPLVDCVDRYLSFFVAARLFRAGG